MMDPVRLDFEYYTNTLTAVCFGKFYLLWGSISSSVKLGIIISMFEGICENISHSAHGLLSTGHTVESHAYIFCNDQ